MSKLSNFQIKLTYIAVAIILMILFYFVGIPTLNKIVLTFGVLVTYPIFLTLVAIISYLIGAVVYKGWVGALVGPIVAFVVDDLAPPYMLPVNVAPVLTPEQAFASDVFLYEIGRQLLNWTHAWSRALAYLIIPSSIVITLIIFLKRKQIKEAIKRAF